MSERRNKTAALTLIEVVLAMSLLVVLILGFASVSTISMSTSRSSKADLVAQEAAARLVEQMRSKNAPAAYTEYWDDTAITKQTIDGVEYAVRGGALEDVLSGPNGLYGYFPSRPGGHAPFGGAVTGEEGQAGLLGFPKGSRPCLRVRFLNEREYKTIWGITSADETVDLDRDGQLDDMDDPPSGTYGLFPVLVEVHWTEGDVARRYQLKTVLTAHPQLDPRRPT